MPSGHIREDVTTHGWSSTICTMGREELCPHGGCKEWTLRLWAAEEISEKVLSQVALGVIGIYIKGKRNDDITGGNQYVFKTLRIGAKLTFPSTWRPLDNCSCRPE